MYIPEDDFFGKFRCYYVQPVVFAGNYANKGIIDPKEYKTIEAARLGAIAIIKRNKDARVKGFILEQHVWRSYAPTVEKVYRLTDYKTKRSSYFMEIDGKKSMVYKLNSKTGEIITAYKKKDLKGVI